MAVNQDLARAVAAVLRDLRATDRPVPRVEPSDWHGAARAASAMLWSTRDGSGQGAWVDTTLAQHEQVVMVADQVQEWAIEELAASRRPTNWPRCPEHPSTHPLKAAAHDGLAVWQCPRSGRPVSEIGRLSGGRARRMSVVPVDERDSGWEHDRPRFRVYLHDSGSRTGGTTWTYDITGADVLQVIDWAQREAGDRRTYAIALVYDDATMEDQSSGHGRGLVWLVGMDGNDVAEPGSPEWAVQQRMLTRRFQPVGIAEPDRAPPQEA